MDGTPRFESTEQWELEGVRKRLARRVEGRGLDQRHCCTARASSSTSAASRWRSPATTRDLAVVILLATENEPHPACRSSRTTAAPSRPEVHAGTGPGDAAAALAVIPDARLVADRLAAVRERIAAACARAGRPPRDGPAGGGHQVRAPAPGRGGRAAPAQSTWARTGSRKRWRARMKPWRRCSQAAGDGSRPLRWHFIGHLQRNKAAQGGGPLRPAARRRLAEAGAAPRPTRAAADGRREAVLLEVNVSGEARKHGLAPAAAAEAVAALAAGCPGSTCCGLMGMARCGRPGRRTARQLRRCCAGPREQARRDRGAPAGAEHGDERRLRGGRRRGRDPGPHRHGDLRPRADKNPDRAIPDHGSLPPRNEPPQEG